MGVLNVTPDSFSDGGQWLDRDSAVLPGGWGVAEAAVRAGATLVNDVSASLHEVAAGLGVGWVAMHMRGEPATMQDDPSYDDVVGEVRDFFVERAERAKAAGVEEVWIDPGIGFGKTIDHNLALLQHLGVLVDTVLPVVVGTSRKTFLGRLTSRASAQYRLEPSGATAAKSVAQSAGNGRVQDV